MGFNVVTGIRPPPPHTPPKPPEPPATGRSNGDTEAAANRAKAARAAVSVQPPQQPPPRPAEPPPKGQYINTSA